MRLDSLSYLSVPILLQILTFLTTTSGQSCIKIGKGKGQLKQEVKARYQQPWVKLKPNDAPVKPVSEPLHADSSSEERSKVDWAYSSVDLVFLAKQEEALFNDVLKYKRSLDKKLEAVNSWLTDYQDSSMKGTDHLLKARNAHQWSKAEAVAGHPLMSYRMIRRFSLEIPRILDNMKETEAESAFFNKIKSFEEVLILPNQTDLEHVIGNILRIQHVYDLDAGWIAIGRILNIQTTVGLTGEQAFEIGSFAAKSDMFPEALNWLLSVAGRAVIDPVNKVDLQAVGKVITDVFEKHDKLFEPNDSPESLTYPYRFMNPLKSKGFVQSYKNFMIEELKQKRRTEQTYANYIMSCNDMGFMENPGNPRLSCWYETGINPIWKLNPLKIEIQSLDTYLVQIHDIIGENMTHFLREEAVPTLARAQTGSTTEDDPTEDFPNPGQHKISTFPRRPTFTTTTLKAGSEKLKALDKKIGLIMSMEMHNAPHVNPLDFPGEGIHISAHGFGGHSFLHNDAIPIRSETTNDDSCVAWVATFMIYLTDVELGGQTVFPLISKTITPSKGSALLWFNYLKNGKADKRLTHGNCPVMLGHLWAATKWIRGKSNVHFPNCTSKAGYCSKVKSDNLFVYG